MCARGPARLLARHRPSLLRWAGVGLVLLGGCSLATGAAAAIRQRQIDSSCLDCDEVGCGVSPLATEWAFGGFTHWPMGVCGADGGAPMDAAAVPEGTPMSVDPAAGLCGSAPTDRFWALCATAPDSGIGRFGPEAFTGSDRASPPPP